MILIYQVIQELIPSFSNQIMFGTSAKVVMFSVQFVCPQDNKKLGWKVGLK